MYEIEYLITEKKPQWDRHVNQGNTLCYSYAEFPKTDRDRVEAALIFKHKPPVNDEFKNSFPFDKTNINLKGVINLLNPKFTVDRTK